MINPFLIRSWLYVPAIKDRFIKKILTLHGVNKPDAIIFDLEESIAEGEKSKNQARQKLQQALLADAKSREKIFSRYIVGVRINNAHSSYTYDDLKIIGKINPHFLILPKAETAKEIKMLQRKYKHIQLCALIETIEGFENRESIIKSLRNCDMVGLGFEDLSSVLGIERPENLYSVNPLSYMVIASIITAKKYNIAIKDAVFRKYQTKTNLKELKKECIYSFTIGLESKSAIHPSQVAIINNVFDKKKLIQKAKIVLKTLSKLNDGTSITSTAKKEMLEITSGRLYAKLLRNFQQK